MHPRGLQQTNPALDALLDLRGEIPAFIHISHGKMHEVNVLNCMPTEPGACYVMDRGYLDFTRLYALHQAGGFFVTRANANMNAARIYSAPSIGRLELFAIKRYCATGFTPSKITQRT